MREQNQDGPPAPDDPALEVPETDPYAWLDGPRQPTYKDWMREQSTRTFALLGAMPWYAALHQRLVLEPKPVMRRFYPGFGGDHLFTTLTDPEDAFQALDRVPTDGNLETDAVRLWPTRIAPIRERLRGAYPSPDGRWCVVILTREGAETGNAHLLELASGHWHSLRLCTSAKVLHWSADSSGFFHPSFASLPNTPSTEAIHYFSLAEMSDTPTDLPPWEQNNQLRWRLTSDRTYLIVRTPGGLGCRQEIAYRVEGPHLGPPLILSDHPTARAWSDAADGHFYIRTTEGASNGRILRTPVDDPANREELIAESDDVLFGPLLLPEVIVCPSLRRMQPILKVFDRDGTLLFDHLAPAEMMWNNYWTSSHERRFSFELHSYAHPGEVYLLDTERLTVRHFGSAAPSYPWTMTALEIPSIDGAMLPGVLVTLNPEARATPGPLILEIHSGPDELESPEFRRDLVPWIEAGGRYLRVVVRGAGGMGADWFRAGQREGKRTAVADVIAAAEWVLAQGLTTTSQLGLWGTRMGDPLIACATMLRPELFGAVVCGSPVTAPLHPMSKQYFRLSIEEYGDLENPEDREFLKQISAFDLADEATTCPPMLFLEVFNYGRRVAPAHMWKLALKLQERYSSDHPILVLGFGGGVRFIGDPDTLLPLTFFAWQLGLELPAAMEVVSTQDDG